MRSISCTTLAMALASGCSSLGGIELQDGAEGRFTAGDDGDPTGPASGGSPAPSSTGDGDDESSGFDGDGALEPPPGTSDDGGDGSSGLIEDTTGTDGSATASDGSSGTTSDGSLDDDTTSDDPQTHGIASTSDSGECTELECLPPCDRQWAAWCDQPCDDALAGTACATKDGSVVSCDLGVWSCAR